MTVQQRAFYRRVGDQFAIAAIGPEASVDLPGLDGPPVML